MNSSAPGISRPSWTSTPSMSVIQHSIGLGSATAAAAYWNAAGPTCVEQRDGCRGKWFEMDTVLTLVVIALIVAGVVWLVRQRTAAQARELEDAKSEARRWVERLGGQVLNLVGTDDASKQALADAAERYTAAGSQMEQARSAAQARQVTETAHEGLYYVRAARTAMGLDPGPELPPLPGQQRAGAVSEEREVEVEGHAYSASPGAVASATGTTTPAARWPAGRCRRAGTPSRGGGLRSSRARGASGRRCCSASLVLGHGRRGLRRRVRRRRRAPTTRRATSAPTWATPAATTAAVTTVAAVSTAASATSDR